MSQSQDNTTPSKDEDGLARIFSSSLIFGGISLLNIFLGIIRNKTIAIWFGPAAVGLIGLLSTVHQTIAMLSQAGVGDVAVRQIAHSQGSESTQNHNTIRRAIFWLCALLAVLGGGFTWLLRDVIALEIFAKPEITPYMGWVALGVFASGIHMYQIALLRGLRQVKALSLTQFLGALLATIIGMTILYSAGTQWVPIYVALFAIAPLLVGAVFCWRWRIKQADAMPLPQTFDYWRQTLKTSMPLLAAAAIYMLTTLWVQAQIRAEYDFVELGIFIAAFTINQQYVGLFLGALDADYLPRLSGVITNHDRARKVVQQQTHMTLIAMSPALLGIFCYADLLMQILYTDAFIAAADALRWFIAGGIIALAINPIKTLPLATQQSYVLLGVSIPQFSILIILTLLLLPEYGIIGACIGYFALYCFYTLYFLVYGTLQIGFFLKRGDILHWVATIGAAGLILLCEQFFTGLIAFALKSFVVSFFVLLSLYLAYQNGLLRIVKRKLMSKLQR